MSLSVLVVTSPFHCGGDRSKPEGAPLLSVGGEMSYQLCIVISVGGFGFLNFAQRIIDMGV